jgi:hypothetical protein
MSSAIDDAVVESELNTAAIREPNFFIVGAAKAGSTSLVEYLRQHPDVFMPGGDFSRKEPAHFCDPIPPWQEKYRDVDTYLGLFADAGDRKAVGEASVAYLAWPGTESRIYARYPHARIVIVLRNPADRVHSWYNFMCQYGIEPGLSLENALAQEEARAADETLKRDNPYWYSSTQYFRFGHYADDIERYVRRFPRQQIHVLLSEDLRTRPAETMRSLHKFLDVDPDFTPSFEMHNETWTPFSPRLQHFLATHTRWQPASAPTDPGGFVERRLVPFAAGVNMLAGRLRKRRFNPATRRALLIRYRNDIRRTEQLIGRSLDIWLKDVR